MSRFTYRCLATYVALAVSICGAAAAGSFSFDKIGAGARLSKTYFLAGQSSIPDGLQSATRVNNTGATLDAGEPTEGGLMQKTVWANYKAPSDGRVVVHTFGSAMDTVLAAYRGTALSSLVRLAGNDDTAVPGFAIANQSLVAFNVKAEKTYQLQAGAKDGGEGDIYFNTAVLPPGGGLTSFLATLAGAPYQGRDYICPLGNGGRAACETPGFIVYNATSKTVTVSASSTLGAGLVAPSSFTLAPGAAAFKEFTFGPSFDATTVRAVTGEFVFTAKAGSKIVGRARHPALIYVKSDLQPDVLELTPSPQIRSGEINKPQSFTVKLANTGGGGASGCFFASAYQSRFKTEFQRINPSSAKPIGGLNDIFDVPPGGSRTFRVRTTSQEGHIADPDVRGPVTATCTNTDDAPLILINNFAASIAPNFKPAAITGKKLSPPSSLLVMSPSSSVNARFMVVNSGKTARLTARAEYLRPPGETDPAFLFTAQICRTATATGPCLAPMAGEVSFKAKKGRKYYFKMRITSPAIDPGYLVGLRRVYAKFLQNLSAPNSGEFLVGVQSIGVKVRE